MDIPKKETLELVIEIEVFLFPDVLVLSPRNSMALGRLPQERRGRVLYPENGMDCYIKPYTDVASNLLAIDLRLNVQIACDGL